MRVCDPSMSSKESTMTRKNGIFTYHWQNNVFCNCKDWTWSATKWIFMLWKPLLFYSFSDRPGRFLKSKHSTSTYLEYELIIAQGTCFRAQPSFPVSTSGLTIVTQHDNLLYAKSCCYGNIQMTNKKLLLIYSPLGSIYVIIKMRYLPRYDPAIASQDIVGARVTSWCSNFWLWH